MTEDELAAFVRDTGSRISRCDGVWWVENQPCFFRPLLPLAEISSAPGKYPGRAWLGGVQHVVPDTAPANSQKSYFVYERLADYDLALLGHSQANKIRKGLKNFHWRRIDSPEHFNQCAYPVYLCFLHRTGYRFKDQRRNPRRFGKWARALFAHPKVVVSGAYRGDQLSAVSIYYLVRDMVINATYFSDTASQPLRVFDFALHKLREEVATTGARFLYMGPKTGVEGIDHAKMNRGCSLITKRTRLHLNPLVGALLKRIGPDSYSRLWGDNLSDGKAGRSPGAKLEIAPDLDGQ